MSIQNGRSQPFVWELPANSLKSPLKFPQCFKVRAGFGIEGVFHTPGAFSRLLGSMGKVDFHVMLRQILKARSSDKLGGLVWAKIAEKVHLNRVVKYWWNKRISEVKGACGDDSEKYGWGSALFSPSSSNPHSISLALGCRSLGFSPYSSLSFLFPDLYFILQAADLLNLELPPGSSSSPVPMNITCWESSIIRVLPHSGWCLSYGCEGAMLYLGRGFPGIPGFWENLGLLVE